MTPVRKMLDIWPPLPIHIDKPAYPHLHLETDADDLIAALEHRDRVFTINLSGLTLRQLERVAAVMQEPFPALTRLHLGSADEVAPALPVTFMGGSAPHLQRLDLEGISFPTLPRLVLSPTDLTALRLHAIPSAGYISPGVMVEFLSPLTRLESLVIEFKFPLPPPGTTSRLLIPPTRTVLPALIYFGFKGNSEYLEDMVAQIDAPQLLNLEAVIFNQFIFSIPRLSHFIRRTETLKSLSQVELSFGTRHVQTKFSHSRRGRSLLLRILCSPSDWQLSSIVQLCGPPFPLPSNVERLEIDDETVPPPKWQDDIDHDQWLEVLQPFTSVRELHLSARMWPRLVPTLKELTGERTMDVLPMLCDLFLGGLKQSESLPETIEPFVATRKLADHPVVVHRLEGQGWKAIN